MRSAESCFPDGDTPEELRMNPAVVKRAAEIKRTRGFDPLAEDTINQARWRYIQWSKLFNRQVVLAVLCGILGGFMTLHHLVGIMGQRPADGENFWMLLGITGVMLLLCSLSARKAHTIRHQLHADLAPFLDAYRELDQLNKSRQ